MAMEVFEVLSSVLSVLRQENVPVCIIGEVALNYYNVPRVVHDLEFCVPEKSLSRAVSILYSTGQYQPRREREFDIYTEYKKAFPALCTRTYPDLGLVLFPDTYFYLAPLDQNVINLTMAPNHGAYSPQILDVVPRSELKDLPLPLLPPFFIGLCRRFFESGDDMARIGAEQLVDGMKVDEKWVRFNLSSVPPEVRYLANTLVSDRPSSSKDGSGEFRMPSSAAGDMEREALRLIPGSGFH